jgi:hypothetical protein
MQEAGMKKTVLDALTAALNSAGFELVSLKEETQRHLYLEGVNRDFHEVEGGGPAFDGGPTGVVLLEIKAI